MLLFAWIVLGLITGISASMIVNRSGQGIWLDSLLGAAGALFCGWVFTRLGMLDLTGFTFHSVLVAIIGAVLLIVLYHSLVCDTD
ncbi:GlsB/YeaQ/YmgE family stress response membrane protein [Chitinimonas viridis]|uniref:GlsB/YeaQ/YmgE family stress response membrane protein n=1 Tax=Chitinimonas viridis TaxID=664880 RepID=A0ABT8AZR2_9NEIS|nr:GlsB/YeaQ/YmgE family stress response membrane protein [Chitinimonas viridis]MDN3575482.1 GlsB/YeaQ/YmgE family stress response membrane protein [Chitinimonas viridis]